MDTWPAKLHDEGSRRSQYCSTPSAVPRVQKAFHPGSVECVAFRNTDQKSARRWFNPPPTTSNVLSFRNLLTEQFQLRWLVRHKCAVILGASDSS
jgi:hypothetical protein